MGNYFNELLFSALKMLSALPLIYLTCWTMSDWMHQDGEPRRCKKKEQHTFSSTKLLTWVTVAVKLVLVNPYWWNGHLFIVYCAVYLLFQVDLYSVRHWLLTSTSVTSPTDIIQYCTIWSWYKRKRIDHWCSVVPAKSQPSGWDFSVLTEHQWWILFVSHRYSCEIAGC